MGGYRISSFIWRKAILIVTESPGKNQKDVDAEGVENTAGPENSRTPANGNELGG
jgi:hypothetical protein